MKTEVVSLATIHQFVVEELLEDTSASIEPTEDLLLSGFLDSMNVLRLVAYLEEKSSLSIPPEDVTLEHFGTLENIHTYINSDLLNR